MTIIVSNPVYTAEGIECIYEHPLYGPIPYHAKSDDPSQIGQDIWSAVQALPNIAPYVAPTPAVPESASKLNLVRALRSAGLWATLKAALSLAPTDTQEDWELAVEIDRNDPLMIGFATANGLTNEQIDAIFIAADS